METSFFLCILKQSLAICYCLSEIRGFDRGDVSIYHFHHGDVSGMRTIKYESSVDEIVIHRSAKSRKRFVLGAVLTAEFVKGKTRFYL